MPIVKMPDGTQVRFPDDMPREQIRDMIASKFPDAAAQSAPAVNTDPGFEPMRDLPIPGTTHPTTPDTRYHSPIPGGDFMNEVATSFAENIPILGPLTNRAVDETGSRISSMISGRPQEEVLAEGQDIRARNAADQPVANAAGTVAGSVGPLMSLGTTKLGEQALGLTGPLWQDRK